VLGHADIKTTMRYLAFEHRTSPDRMTAAREAAGIEAADVVPGRAATGGVR
jgi:hypothetical protein